MAICDGIEHEHMAVDGPLQIDLVTQLRGAPQGRPNPFAPVKKA
jgi:hypothetical protein